MPWLKLHAAPEAKVVCSEACALVNMTDFAIRPAYAMPGNAVLNTGKYNYRFIRTPHLLRGWNAGVIFEETNNTLLCCDLFYQNGNVADITNRDILASHRNSMLEFEQRPLMEYTLILIILQSCFIHWQTLNQKHSQPCMVLHSMVIVVRHW